MNFLIGFLIGVVSLIPGISGGTVLVMLDKYEWFTMVITNLKEKQNKFIILTLLIGVILGTITFARIAELLFYFFPQEILIIFGGLVLFSLKDMIKKEASDFSIKWFLVGAILMSSLSLISYNDSLVISNYPKITLIFLIWFLSCGMIDGFFTILPGISGSMIMMILGPYFLYKSYLANLSWQYLYFIIPLSFYFLGDLLGIFLGGKFSLFCLKKNRKLTMSLLWGMVLMSAILIMPGLDFSFKKIVYYLIFLVISYLITKVIQLFG